MKKSLKTTTVAQNNKNITTVSGYHLQDDYSTLYISISALAIAFILATTLISIAFSGMFNFWLSTTISTIILTALCIIWGNIPLTKNTINPSIIIFAIISALLFYAICYLGAILWHFIFPLSRAIESIYTISSTQNIILASVILAIIIAPGEEIFWRGFIMRAIATKTSSTFGIIFSAILYALAHSLTFNPLLVISAFVGGLLWGWLYARSSSLWLSVITHSIWSLLVYIILPFN